MDNNDMNARVEARTPRDSGALNLRLITDEALHMPKKQMRKPVVCFQLRIGVILLINNKNREMISKEYWKHEPSIPFGNAGSFYHLLTGL